MEGAIHAVCELLDLHSGDGWGVLIITFTYVIGHRYHVYDKSITMIMIKAHDSV